jgi:hypothetical protein
MNIENIKLVYKDLNDVLSSPEANLAETDRARLLDAKALLANEIAAVANHNVDTEKQRRLIQLVIWIIEIIRNISDNF